MPLHIALQLEHLRGEHQVNGFMGCDCHIELTFKRWKSLLALHVLKGTRPERIRCLL